MWDIVEVLFKFGRLIVFCALVVNIPGEQICMFWALLIWIWMSNEHTDNVVERCRKAISYTNYH